MKRIALLVVLLLLVTSTAYAKPCPLPEVNTDKEIKFNGLDWYTDYNETVKNLEGKGFKNEVAWARDEVPTMAAHWHSPFSSVYYSEKNTGCRFSFFSIGSNKLPKTAGYDLHSLEVYLMWNPERGFTEDYKADNALQFYYAGYCFDVTDKEYAYNDLAGKLKSVYGDNPYVGTSLGKEYLVWVNTEQAAIVLARNSIYVELIYMAPHAEENLVAVEEKERQRENGNAEGDFTGL